MAAPAPVIYRLIGTVIGIYRTGRGTTSRRHGLVSVTFTGTTTTVTGCATLTPAPARSPRLFKGSLLSVGAIFP